VQKADNLVAGEWGVQKAVAVRAGSREVQKAVAVRAGVVAREALVTTGAALLEALRVAVVVTQVMGGREGSGYLPQRLPLRRGSARCVSY
jgi:hypothetical protein